MEVHQLANGPITAHAFNGDRSQVALCPNNNEVQIFARTTDGWRLSTTLKGHDKLITCIDWAPKTNRIVTCAQDRNAYVWVQDAKGAWKPTLVLLRLNRAATFVRWSPLENKFAVASGARCISVCYFEQENDWWVSKHLKKPIRSTVLTLDWHPNNVLLAAGSADMKARVFSAYIKGLDDKPPASPWGERLPFNTLCAEYYNGHGGWIHAVAFSPDGNQLAWVGHDSSLNIADPATNAVYEVKTPFLPFLSLIWASPKSIIAAGHDCQPMLFQAKTGTAAWAFVEKLDAAGASSKKPSSYKPSAGGTLAGNAALAKFKQLDSHGQNSSSGMTGGASSTSTSADLNTTHQNSINNIKPFQGARASVTKFSTSGMDGKVVIWDVKSLESAIAGLSIA